MYQIRFHGRGGQGIKTASHILGNALFLAGFEVQDAPRYGAERRGAPIYAYVRADKNEIFDRGIITHPDLIIVVDDTLLLATPESVLEGLSPHTVILLYSKKDQQFWQAKLAIKNKIILLPELLSLTIKNIPTPTESEEGFNPIIGTLSAAAACALIGAINQPQLESALQQELADLSPESLKRNIALSVKTFELLAARRGIVKQSDSQIAANATAPDTPAMWIDLPFEKAELASPNIYAPQTSRHAATGLWRTMRPVIDYEKCHNCYWICSTYCPDSAIDVIEGNKPVINYDQCKGCMICVMQCPPKAIDTVSESEEESP